MTTDPERAESSEVESSAEEAEPTIPNKFTLQNILTNLQDRMSDFSIEVRMYKI